MRVLAVSTGGAGHFEPMTPFIAACTAAGHEVLCAAPDAVASAVARHGWRHAVLPSPPPEAVAPLYAQLPTLSLQDANRLMVRDVFGGANVDAALAPLERIVEDFRPDLVLREAAELASYVVASRRQIEQVQVAIGLQRVDDFVLETLQDALEDRFDVSAAGLSHVRALSLAPPSLEVQPRSRLRTREHYRPSREIAAAALPEGWPAHDDRPLVYVSFGTVAAGVGLYPDLYRMVLDALAPLPVRVLMTIGRDADPSQLGRLPENAHVEQWWPQEAALQSASLAVGHGGFGTTLGALRCGVPIIFLPLFAIDQHYNAEAVTAAGAGRIAAPPAADSLADAVTHLLDDGRAHAAAAELAAELRTLRPVEQWLVAPGGAG